jgi:hypothetical protein
MEKEVSHAEIYARLLTVEQKVDRIDENTQGVVKAFEAATGAFLVLDWIGKLAKPILFIGGCLTAISLLWDNFKNHK